MRKNHHVYKRVGLDLRYVSTVNASTPEEAARHAADTPGKYVVVDRSYCEIDKVNVTLTAERATT